ncbi:MAG: YceI family protein [Flavobacteriales bacterium]|jgi:polyisoprenoid-binding protein YceI|nr:YceI family protein [Flavobacteriales bacterium]NCG43280.1 YceI family protein [Euryarchaeota archaeon]MBT4704039.1 YceI family protein [Flavobacteriales bacterium]MBT4930265.1 YceI family protein [Flavobacteriales bacterium]MBT5132488.1 YceI family protein [Flavobacteriales bacterium]
MKLLLVSALILCSSVVSAQGKYFTRDGHVKFFSATSVEDIEARNHKLTCVLDAASGQFEFAALMKSFEFKKPLMEEHFNENFVESNKYPKGTFKGSVQGLDGIDMANIPSGTNVVAAGKLEIHGVVKELELAATIESRDGGYAIHSTFKIVPEDYNIEIPNTVRDNIAKVVDVTVEAQLKAFNR